MTRRVRTTPAQALALLVVMAAAAGSAWAQPAAAPTLDWPVDCRLGVDCVIQQYPDLDPGPGVVDFGCGRRSYDGHRGVDIRVRARSDLAPPVAVLAAAEGVVVGRRDGMPDRIFRPGSGIELGGQDCGNGVRIDHGGGWSTQYCHLADGSVAVDVGDRVRAGDRLGDIGLSGRTEFPHLHLTLARDGAPVDPFTGRAIDQGPLRSGPEACAATDASLWRAPLGYEPLGLLGMGFWDGPVAQERVEAGDIPHVQGPTARAPQEWPALVAWVRLMGVAAGDEVLLRLMGSDGAILAENTDRSERDYATRLLFAGVRAPSSGFAPGRRIAVVVVRRAGREIHRSERAVDLR